MSKFLLDTNLSPKLIHFLESEFHFDVIQIIIPSIPDEEVIKLAKKEKRVIITFDKDFGEAYHLREHGKVGIIALRLSDQRTEIVINTLQRFFASEAENIDLDTALVIIDDTRIRIVRPQ